MNTIATPHRCPCCEAPVARERIEVLARGRAFGRPGRAALVAGAAAWKRRYLDIDGQLHTCARRAA